MELKEYLKEMTTKIDNDKSGDNVLMIYVTEHIEFKYHNECFADYQEDFVIMYDKVSETSMVIPYHKIAVIQYITRDVFEKQSKEILKRLLDD